MSNADKAKMITTRWWWVRHAPVREDEGQQRVAPEIPQQAQEARAVGLHGVETAHQRVEDAVARAAGLARHRPPQDRLVHGAAVQAQQVEARGEAPAQFGRRHAGGRGEARHGQPAPAMLRHDAPEGGEDRRVAARLARLKMARDLGEKLDPVAQRFDGGARRRIALRAR